MSLLNMQADPGRRALAEKVFDQHFKQDPRLEREYDERRRRLMFEDILYNISYLTTAVYCNDSKIFSDYARWLYLLLCNLMKDLDRDRIKDQMVDHYRILSDVLAGSMTESEMACASACMDEAIRVTEEAVPVVPLSKRFKTGKHLEIRQQYLDALIRSDTRGAASIIEQCFVSGIPIEEIYQDILQEVMYEVGELWHQSHITIDKEHYCTSTTQTILSRFYQEIFSQPRAGRTILVCCVGSELHEMGGRMLSDLFEYHGWDSVYLGAAVPPASLLNAIQEHKPELIALSLTMPPDLPLCHEMVLSVRDKYPTVKIAVGGGAFQRTDSLWAQWPIDYYAENASQLLTQVQRKPVVQSKGTV